MSDTVTVTLTRDEADNVALALTEVGARRREMDVPEVVAERDRLGSAYEKIRAAEGNPHRYVASMNAWADGRRESNERFKQQMDMLREHDPSLYDELVSRAADSVADRMSPAERIALLANR